MAIIKWDPFRDLLSLPEEVGRVFGRTFGELAEPFFARGAWAPSLDMYETDNEIVVKAELPGLTSKDIDITVNEDSLTIKGERRLSDEVKEENYYRLERRYGMFQRVVPLPSPILKDKVKATFREGVLEIKMPKTKEIKPKRVKVAIEAGEREKVEIKKKR